MALTGTQPWTSVPTTVIDVPAASVRPAFNLSYENIQTALNSFNGTFAAKLKVPTTAQWQFASTGGSSGSWSWGNATDHATIAANAVVWETHGSSLGPQAVGSKLASGYGLFDMHGNVWEWTSPGITVCGGSWSESFRLSTINSSLKALNSTTSHALVGVRLLLIP
jgi:formylglycine-generating enzyme required for sulfatase activity